MNLRKRIVEDSPIESSEDSNRGRKQVNRAFGKCKPKNQQNAMYEQMTNPEENVEFKYNSAKKIAFFVDKGKNDSESDSFSESQSSEDAYSGQECDKSQKGNERHEDIYSNVDSDFEEVLDWIEESIDYRGRTIWQIMNPDCETRYFTEKAILSNQQVRKQFYESFPDRKQEQPIKKREKKAVEKKTKRKKRAIIDQDDDDEPKHRPKPKEDKERQAAKLKNYVKKAIEDQIRQHGQKGLNHVYMDDVIQAEAIQKDMNTLKQEKVDDSVFNEVGTMEKHIPLEIIDFIGQPPFRGDKDIKVLVRWKYFDKQNYQPQESEVYYYQLRDNYKKLLIDLFVRKTQLTCDLEK